MKSRPNIFLIVMDTVRADHLSCYGYHRKTTPNIDQIAAGGALFENAFTTSTWTPPSHASIFTGKYPFQHGTIGKNTSLRQENTTLAEILSLDGYESIGIAGCELLGSQDGFGKGFRKYIDLSEISFQNPRFSKAKAKDLVRRILQGEDSHTYRISEIAKSILEDGRSREKPVFLFINYFNCHVPYSPPRSFKKKFHVRGTDLSSGRISFLASGKGFQAFVEQKLQISSIEWQAIKSLYDSEIAYLDDRIGELFTFLHSEELLDNALFIITSDHGEFFGEHGLAGHVFSLYDELIHVPLILFYPKEIRKGVRISNIVSTVDILPTVVDLLKIKMPRGKFNRSLWPFHDLRYHDFIIAECGYELPEEKRLLGIQKRCKCIRTSSHKYIYSLDSMDEELYDLRRDPCEHENIAPMCPKKAAYFRKQLEMTIPRSRLRVEPPSPRKEEIRKRLKSLGYI